jgi:PII-like signaling protein
MYDSCLLSLKGRPASPFLVERFIDNCFDFFPVTLRGWSGHPRGKIIHESNRTALAVNLPLYKICVEK